MEHYTIVDNKEKKIISLDDFVSGNLDKVRRIVDSYGSRKAVFDGLDFEPKAYRESGKKKLLTYDKHEARLKKAGYDRAPTSQEAFGLIIAHLEGKLKKINPVLDEVARDMLDSYGEFFCQAVQRKGNKWIIFEKATGLKWDNSNDKYNIPRKKWYENKVVFDISGLAVGKWISLKEVDEKHPELIEYFYTRPFKGLPKHIGEVDMYIPNDNNMWPVGRSIYSGAIDVRGCYSIRASRGMRKRQRRFTEKSRK